MAIHQSSSEQKHQLRTEALSRRAAQADKETVSRQILERLFSLPEYQAAETVLFYVDVRGEARTRWVLPDVLSSGKCLVVPYCVGTELELFRLRDLSELTAGRFGILEPDPVLRDLSDRRVAPEELDLLIVPGVAFDRRGGRLGHGFGYYDRLLARTRLRVLKIGLAFECQIVPLVPMEPHDVPLDAVITENGISSSRISSR